MTFAFTFLTMKDDDRNITYVSQLMSGSDRLHHMGRRSVTNTVPYRTTGMRLFLSRVCILKGAKNKKTPKTASLLQARGLAKPVSGVVPDR